MHLWSALVLLTTLSLSEGYHILCVSPVPSQSHNLIAKGIVVALLDAGHEVTWATPYPQKTARKNLKYIDLSVIQKLTLDMTDPRNRNAGMWLVKEFSRNISSAALGEAALRDALLATTYDALVTEWFFSDADAGFAAIQQVPWILLSGMTMHPHLESLVDTTRSVATHPMPARSCSAPMSLPQRLGNTLMYTAMTITGWLEYPSNEAFYRSSFEPLAAARGVPLPPFSEAVNNVSVLFVNSHPSIDPPRSLPPNVVDIAGYHIDKDVPALPKDLQTLLDASPGFVYFSLGSVVKASALPERTQQELLRVLGELPCTVLWKFERELKGVPENVHVRPWMPQSSILAHPNIKLFITHGGLLSTIEAAHFGVPLLAIPVFGDQPSNAGRSVRAGVARSVAFSTDMAGELKVELQEMLENDSYYKKAKELSALFRARPVQPPELIAHYVKLAIETKGAFHLRSASKLYAWYELWMLDQIAVFLVTLYLVWTVLKKILGFLKNILVKSKKQKRS